MQDVRQDTPTVPIDDQVLCVKREIRFRERVYPRWVSEARMTKAEADHQLAVMRAVLATLEQLREQQRPGLF